MPTSRVEEIIRCAWCFREAGIWSPAAPMSCWLAIVARLDVPWRPARRSGLFRNTTRSCRAWLRARRALGRRLPLCPELLGQSLGFCRGLRRPRFELLDLGLPFGELSLNASAKFLEAPSGRCLGRPRLPRQLLELGAPPFQAPVDLGPHLGQPLVILALNLRHSRLGVGFRLVELRRPFRQMRFDLPPVLFTSCHRSLPVVVMTLE